MTYNSYNPPYCNGNPALIYFVGRGVTGGWGGEVPTYDLVNEYEVKDPRKVHTIFVTWRHFSKKKMEMRKCMIIQAMIISQNYKAVSIM